MISASRVTLRSCSCIFDHIEDWRQTESRQTENVIADALGKRRKILSNNLKSFPRRSSHERSRPITFLPFPPLGRVSKVPAERVSDRRRFRAGRASRTPRAHRVHRVDSLVDPKPAFVRPPAPRPASARASPADHTSAENPSSSDRPNRVRPNHRAIRRERRRSRARDARDEPLNVGRDASAGA